uniref:Transposase n=1 Tax=Leptospirillum sp. Group II '5-way CG' TaxID=419541 RepID=B6AQ45_9BACT|nr:MAG: transposase [Leptospirillum sp. Group II '5-way CG']
MRPFRRINRRPRFRKTCSCPGTPATLQAPPAPRLIPKGKIGVSLWVTLLRDKFDSNQPTARLLKDLERHGLHLSPGTITDGLRRISEFFHPLYEAIREKSRTASVSQADETRYYVTGDTQGQSNGSQKSPHRWWLWIILTASTVLYVIDPSRSAKVPFDPFFHRESAPSWSTATRPTNMPLLGLSDSRSPSAGPMFDGILSKPSSPSLG